MDAATRPPTKAAVSSSVQMNSSTISMTSMGMAEASPRSAMRKIGILSLRERRNFRKARARLLILVFSQRPVDQHRVDRGVRRDHRLPSSADVASTTSIAAALQLLHERPYRTSLGGWFAELVVHDERAQLIRVMLRWIISTPRCSVASASESSVTVLGDGVFHWKNVPRACRRIRRTTSCTASGKSGDA